MKDRLYRKTYDAHMGIKNEVLAYDFWCAGWDAAVAQIRLNQSVVHLANTQTAANETRYKKQQ